MLARAQRGVTLVELMIGLAVVAILMVLALPEYSTFIRNTKVKNLAVSIESGLQLARAEAIRRNANVRFQLVSNMANDCAIGGTTVTSPNWVVSLEDPSNKCDVAPSETTAPKTVQKWNAAEGAAGLSWNLAVAGIANSLVTFNGLGRVTPTPAALVTIEVQPTTTSDIACVPTGNIRCLRVTVSSAGQVRVCDPQMTIATDPRKC